MTSTSSCSTRPARSPTATGWRRRSPRPRASAEAEVARRRRCSSSIRDETPEGRSIVELARKRLAELGRPAGAGDDAGFAALDGDDRRGDPVPRRDPHERRHDHGRRRPSSRARSTRSRRRSAALPAEVAADADRIADLGRHAARRSSATAAVLGLIELKDTVKEGLVGALRRVPPDGHPDRDDHRRQPADRGDDRRGGGRRRLHRRRPSPRTRSRSSARSRPTATSWR